MIIPANLRRQARVCERLAEDCDDPNLAERLKVMASDLIAKADDVEELPEELPDELQSARLRRDRDLMVK